MKVGLTAHPGKPAALELARRAIERIGDRAELILSDGIASLAPDRPHASLEAMGGDALLAIGGDGTFLYAMRRTDAPLLPVNAGTVGVLAEVEAHRPEEFDAAIDRLLEGRYFLEERMKLAAQIGAHPIPDVVNEYVVHAAQVGKMGLFELSVDDRLVGRVQADGIIVASATGSTGYSLSLFGPIVDPTLDALVLTAIAPFRVEARAVVVDPLRTVRIRPIAPERASVVILDGQEEIPLEPSSSVTVYRSPRRAKLVRFGTGFFERMRGKRILPWSDAPEGGVSGRADLPSPP